MKADAILNKIREDAKNLSADILKEAREKAENMQYEANATMERLSKQTREQAEIQVEQMRNQMESLKDLEFKKRILTEKRKLIDKTFQRAKAIIKILSPDEIRSKVTELILSQAEGGEQIIVGEFVSSWFNTEVLNYINAKLKADGKDPLVVLSNNTRKGCTGAVLSKACVETMCTLETLIDNMKSVLENDIAKELFTIRKEN